MDSKVYNIQLISAENLALEKERYEILLSESRFIDHEDAQRGFYIARSVGVIGLMASAATQVPGVEFHLQAQEAIALGANVVVGALVASTAFALSRLQFGSRRTRRMQTRKNELMNALPHEVLCDEKIDASTAGRKPLFVY